MKTAWDKNTLGKPSSTSRSQIPTVDYQRNLEKKENNIEARKLVCDTGEAIAMIDLKRTIVAASDYFCQISGYSRDEIVGKSIYFLNLWFHDVELFQSIWNTISLNKTWHGQICNQTKSGQLYYVDATIEPLIGATDSVEAFLIIFNSPSDSLQYVSHRSCRKTNTQVGATREEMQKRANVAIDLAAALLNDEIEIALQPQINFSTMKHSGLEALLRLKFDLEGFTIEQVIEIAEANYLGILLGDAVIERACKLHGQMKSLGFEPGMLSLNVSNSQLGDAEFGRRFIETCNKYGLSPFDVCVEITETTKLEQYYHDIILNIKYLHDKGILIALDDFGTGYASLTHLTTMPIDVIKVDRSFVMNMKRGSKHALVTEALVKLSKEMKIKIVAEGIETEEQFILLKEMGCDYGQGYLFAKPIEANKLHQYLRERN